MNLVDKILFRNHPRHEHSHEADGILVYAMNGSLYYRVNNGTPHLFGGVLIQETGSVVNSNVRGNRQTIATAGTTQITFTSPLGAGVHDYEVYENVKDADGAVPPYELFDFTRNGFKVITYNNNVEFGYTAVGHL